MDRAIAEALGTIDRTDMDAPLASVDLDAIDHVLGELPALAWGDSDASLARLPAARLRTVPNYSALIIGSLQIAEALSDSSAIADDEAKAPTSTFTCESTPDAQTAFELARTTQPELIVLDADLDHASELVEALMDEPLTEATAIVVLGSFLEPAEASRYVALGVAKTIAKPTSKGSLRRACEIAIESRHPAIATHGTPGAADVPYGDRGRNQHRGPASEVELAGRTVVVADDDPAVVWFLADLLKAAGCTVHEAFDGKKALELAYRTNPDLMLCDILMPQLDGFTLCRQLRRDVALRDLPVILLSWKEDLLQRVRELGAGAAGYLRKETDARAILARIREALRPRAHMEVRLEEVSNEVRGRMDGISVRTLLEMVAKSRPNSRLTLRDASFNYEIEIRNGAPKSATRTSGDTTVLHGHEVLARMLGASAGRFTVVSSNTEVPSSFRGSLAHVLSTPVARARAATSLLMGSAKAKIRRVHLETVGLEDYLRAMPDAVRVLAERMAAGTPPRALSLEGAADPSLIDDVTFDLASRGFFAKIEDSSGEDLLSSAVEEYAHYSIAPADRCTDDASCEPCESPAPGDVVRTAPKTGSATCLEDAVLLALESESPAPSELAHHANIPADEARAARVQSAANVATPEVPSVLALGDATAVDDTTYGPAAQSVPIPIDESVPSQSRAAKTSLTATTLRSDAFSAGVMHAKKNAWPWVAICAATAIAVWVVVHFA
jgi:DNA-binding response OmpR family regulator